VLACVLQVCVTLCCGVCIAVPVAVHVAVRVAVRVAVCAQAAVCHVHCVMQSRCQFKSVPVNVMNSW